MIRRGVAALGALVVLGALIALTGCGRDAPAVVGAEVVAPPDRGEPLPLSGTTLDGQPFDIADLRGRVVVLNSWASWCGPCRDEIPDLVALARDADPATVAVVGLNVTDKPDAARAFVDEFAVPYPSVTDPAGAILRTIPGVPPAALPSTVILDTEGRVAARIIGPTTTAQVASMIAEVDRSAGPG